MASRDNIRSFIEEKLPQSVLQELKEIKKIMANLGSCPTENSSKLKKEKVKDNSKILR